MPDQDNKSLILVITASVSSSSRSRRLGDYIGQLLSGPGKQIEYLQLRDLPAEPLLVADTSHPEIAAAVELVQRADGIVLVTPTYKGSFSGILKVFLDLLPQYALRGKCVLPLATGGTIAHVLMLDHGLRPVLQSMWPYHVAQGCFVLDKQISISGDEQPALDQAAVPVLNDVLGAYEQMLASSTAPVTILA